MKKKVRSVNERNLKPYSKETSGISAECSPDRKRWVFRTGDRYFRSEKHSEMEFSNWKIRYEISVTH